MAIDIFSPEVTFVQSLEKFLNKRFDEIFTSLDTLERQVQELRDAQPVEDKDDVCSIC